MPRASADSGPQRAFSPLGRFILDRLDRGVALLDAQGNVLDANALGQRVVGDHSGLQVRNGRLVFADAALDARFARYLSRSPNAHSFAASVKRRGANACRLLVTPMHGLDGLDPVVAYLAVIYAIGERDISKDVLIELYGLTPAQADVARKLYTGRSVEETAAELKLSLNTVRTHLKQVFSKCEVQSQAELLHALAVGPHRL